MSYLEKCYTKLKVYDLVLILQKFKRFSVLKFMTDYGIN